MKKLLKRVLGITASVALLVTSSLTAWAEEPTPGHSHTGGTVIDDKSGAYTITLTHPEGEPFVEDSGGVKGSHYGAYQIFSGTVKGENYTGTNANPGEENKKIPITDIKWGNAFCSANDGDLDPTNDISGQENILKFVYALYSAPKGSYKYAFDVFDGDFNKFITTGTTTMLSLNYTDGTEVTFTLDDGGKVTNISNLGNVNYNKLAVAIADILAEQTDREWLQAFNDILGGYGQGESGYLNEGYVYRFYEGKINDDDEKKYEITVPAGYYMIRDLSGFEDKTDKSYSARLLLVANNVEQELKEAIPTLDKNVVRTDGKLYETEAAGVGDEVKFRLTGTLPSNYDLFLGGYQYKFTDTLSKGLTLKENSDSSGGKYYVTVKVKNVYNSTTGELVTDDDGKEYTITTKSCKKDGTHTKHEEIEEAYTEVYNTTDGKNELTVTFPCLKEIVITGADGKTYTLGEKSVIYIDYTAVVNENAIVSPADGNKNKAVLTYSDNPQSYGDTDETTPDEATVYTFGLDIVKVDAAEFLKNDNDAAKAALSGAKFILVRSTATENVYEIAKFVEVKATSIETDPFKGEKYYSIDSWENLGTLDKDGSTTPGDKTDDTLEGLFGKLADTSGYELETYSEDDVKGHLNISGLNDDVTYTMVETVTPDDAQYAKINPFTIELKAATEEKGGKDEYTGKLSGAASDQDTDGSFSFDKPVDITDTFGTADDGSANMLVANFKYIDLPSTGGVGTIWFYIFGVAGIALSGVLFFLSKKKVTR